MIVKNFFNKSVQLLIHYSQLQGKNDFKFVPSV